MRIRTLVLGSLLFLAATSLAEAATGWVVSPLHLRTGPSAQHRVITTMPAGARVDIVRCTSWCELYFAGRHGWASARYISTSRRMGPPVYAPPPPPTIYWYYGPPRWDRRYDSWYDGHSWWYDGRWHRRPRSGVEFYFHF